MEILTAYQLEHYVMGDVMRTLPWTAILGAPVIRR